MSGTLGTTSVPKLKSKRISLSPEQSALLKTIFLRTETPSIEEVNEISTQTGLTSKWIKGWFSRQRSKKVKETKRRPSKSHHARSETAAASTFKAKSKTVSKHDNENTNTMTAASFGMDKSMAIVDPGGQIKTVQPTPVVATGRVFSETDASGGTGTDIPASSVFGVFLVSPSSSHPAYTHTRYPLEQIEQLSSPIRTPGIRPTFNLYGPVSGAEASINEPAGVSLNAMFPLFAPLPVYASRRYNFEEYEQTKPQYSPRDSSMDRDTTRLSSGETGSISSAQGSVQGHDTRTQPLVSFAGVCHNVIVSPYHVVDEGSLARMSTPLQYTNVPEQQNSQLCSQSHGHEESMQNTRYISLANNQYTNLASPFKHIIPARSVSTTSQFTNNWHSKLSTRLSQQDILSVPGEYINAIQRSEKVIEAGKLPSSPLILRDRNLIDTATTEGNAEFADLVLHYLDPDLPEKDPFQAAMGLVLLSRLGLKWDSN